MSVAILVLALVAYGYVLLVYPEFRRWGLIGGVLAGAALGFYLWQQDPEAVQAGHRIESAQITLDTLALEHTPRGVTLSGRVTNRSPDYTLRDMTLLLRLRDCPAPGDAPEDCPVIGESRAIARPGVPPGQIRGFSAHFVFADLPSVAGTLRWDWEIVETRATEG